MKRKVLVTASHYEELCQDAINLFHANNCELIINHKEMPFLTFEELSQVMGDIDGVVLGLDDWTEEVFKLSPKLKALAKFGVGVDNIDLEAAKRHGIKVINAKGKNANAVAELCLCFMLDSLRQASWLNGELKQGKWHRFVGHDISGMTIGLLGFGDIARRVAKKLMGFDVNIIAYDMFPNEEAARELNVTLVNKEDVLRNSDILSIHIPCTEENLHIMNKETFAMMKPGSYFINTARGGLVDTEALCDAVESGHLAGAATDVYEEEPLSMDSRILKIPNIITTPHTGAETAEVYKNVALYTAQEVIDVLDGKDPVNWVNR